MITQYYLKHHVSSQHGICVPQTRGNDEKLEGPTTYVVPFPRVPHLVRCPVPVCPAVCYSAGRLQEKFIFRHFRSWIAVVHEEREPLPRCDMCGMHVPAGQFFRNIPTERYERNTQMMLRRQDVEIVSKCVGATFRLTGDDGAECFEGVESFKY